MLHGRPLIWYVIRQVKKAKKVKKIILAIPKGKKDKNLYLYLKRIGIEIYRGSEKNVAGRIVSAAKKFKANLFMRISGDSPLIKPSIIDRCIYLQKKFVDYDLITNVFPRTFPSGQSVEIIKTNIIEKNIKKMKKKEREHVTLFFYKYYNKFKIKNFISKSKKLSSKNSIDTLEDFHKLKKFIKK